MHDSLKLSCAQFSSILWTTGTRGRLICSGLFIVPGASPSRINLRIKASTCVKVKPKGRPHLCSACLLRSEPHGPAVSSPLSSLPPSSQNNLLNSGASELSVACSQQLCLSCSPLQPSVCLSEGGPEVFRATRHSPWCQDSWGWRKESPYCV